MLDTNKINENNWEEKMKKVKRFLLGAILFVLEVNMIGCGTKSEVASESTQESEEEVVLSEEYENLKGYLRRYSEEYEFCAYQALDVVGKIDSSNAYLVRDKDGNEMQFSEDEIELIGTKFGIVRLDSSVYAEPDETSDLVNVGWGFEEHGEYVLDAGHIVVIDSAFESEKFYHIRIQDDSWTGYVLKENIEIVATGTISGTITEESNIIDGTCSMEWSITGDVKEGEKVIVLARFKVEYYPDDPVVNEPNYFFDSYFILTEDGEIGYVDEETVLLQ